MSRNVLEIRRLRVTAARDRHVILEGVDMDFREGRVTAVLGGSGSGKSTVLNSILGLPVPGLRLTAGQVLLRVGDRRAIDLRSVSVRERRAILGREIAYVPQDVKAAFDPLMTIRESLVECLRCHNLHREDGLEMRLEQAASSAGLPPGSMEDLAGRRPDHLSGGQCQRFLIAQAQLLRPRVLLFDEPTTALDTQTKREVLGAIRSLCESGSAAVVVSHDIAAVRAFADDVYVLEAGRVVERGTVDDVLVRPAHPHTRRLMSFELPVHERVELASLARI